MVTEITSIAKGKNIFEIGESVLIKEYSGTIEHGEISKIDGNIISISKSGNFFYNYHIKTNIKKQITLYNHEKRNKNYVSLHLNSYPFLLC